MRHLRSANRVALLSVLLLVGLVPACGGAPVATEEAPPTPPARGARAETPPAARRDGVAISGLMGTISAEFVRDTLQLRQDRFLRCFTQRLDDVPVLGGTIELAFRVRLDGTVRWVYPRRSTVGDRETERCILEVASTVHFRRPNGGEAEFSWPFEVGLADDVRPPLNWGPERLVSPLASARDLAARCRAPGTQSTFAVTAYVGAGGRVLAAGAAASDVEGLPAIDCVLDAVRGFAAPDPGAYPAKITFDVR
jgi:hypothetical protein